ncbi:MAG: TonB-dependent receptor plug domain-containing protein [Panacagrimonas sp.]
MTLPEVTVVGEQVALHTSGVSIRVPVDPLGATSLANLLGALPGVQVRSSGGLGSYSEASLRGSSGRQVRLLLDGLPLDTGGGDATSLSLVSPLLLESVDIYKGRVPVNLGAGLAGTLNLRTRRVLPAPVVGSASIGSFGQRQLGAAAQLSSTVQLSAATQAADNDFRYVNGFGAFDPGDPNRSRERERENAATAQNVALLRYQGAMRVDAQLLDDRQELPTRANNASDNAELDTRAYGLSLATPEDADWQAVLSHRFTRERFMDRESQIGLGGQDSQSDTRRSLLRLGRQFEIWQTASTAEFTDYTSHDRLSDAPTAAARRFALGQGLEYQTGPRLPLGLDANASLNAGWSQEHSDQRQEDEWQLDPGIGATRTFGVCVAAVNLGHRKRLPTFFERYGDRGQFKGNPKLDPESATYADAGMRCVPGTVVRRVELTFFGQDLSDAISPAYNAQGVGRSENTTRAVIRGIELGGGGRWAGFDWQLGATTQHTEDRSDVRALRGQQLPGRFENQVFTRLERRWGALAYFYAFRFESGQFYDSSNLLPAEPLRRHDVGVRGAVQAVGWSVQALNLRDDNAEQFNGFPTPGRQLLLSLTYPESSPKE